MKETQEEKVSIDNKPFYKVTLMDNKGRHLSAVTSWLFLLFGENSPYILEYKQHQETKAPKGTKIFIFDDPDIAKDFAKWASETIDYDLYIWKCKASGIRQYDFIPTVVHSETIREFWEGKARDDIRPPIEGTLVADSITLIEPIMAYYQGEEVKLNGEASGEGK